MVDTRESRGPRRMMAAMESVTGRQNDSEAAVKRQFVVCPVDLNRRLLAAAAKVDPPARHLPGQHLQRCVDFWTKKVSFPADNKQQSDWLVAAVELPAPSPR
jgi:hypothetical protein